MPGKPKTQAPAQGPTLCSVCAWRADCQKKFSYQQGGPVKCPDFSRDLSLPKPEKTSHEK